MLKCAAENAYIFAGSRKMNLNKFLTSVVVNGECKNRHHDIILIQRTVLGIVWTTARFIEHATQEKIETRFFKMINHKDFFFEYLSYQVLSSAMTFI